MMSANVGGKKITCWADAWDETTLQYADPDGLSDIASQASDSIVDESQIFDVKQRMLRTFKSQLYTDVIFYSTDRKRSISAHRVILAAGSPFFAKKLFGEVSEYSVAKKMEVQIKNLSFEAFSCIVKYLYTDEVLLESDGQAQVLLEGATQFEIHSLVQRCNTYFESQELTEQNVCFKLQTSMSNKIEVLKKRCIEYIQANTDQIINCEDFQKCNLSTIRTICKLQPLNLQTEVDLLNAVMRWSNNQNVPDKKQLIAPLIKCFRFLTFTVIEFSEVMRSYPKLMTADDGLKIMLHLSNPPKTLNFKSLPTWLNKSCMKRCVATEKPYQAVLPEKISPCDDTLLGKIIFPLRFTSNPQIITELTSLLQMKCIYGFQQIKAIKLSFQAPVFVKSVIKNITIKVHVHPCNINIFEHIEVINSLEVTVTFSRPIKVRQGDLIDIEAEAKNIQFYSFLEFDETCRIPENRHFQSCVSSRPKGGKLYFIKEVEYGPQDNPRVGPRHRVRKCANAKSSILC